MTRPSFSFDDFKKWMDEHEEEDRVHQPYQFENNLLGLKVESKISSKKLASKIIAEEGELEDLVFDFKKNGGEITEVNGKDFLIEVNSGKFYLSRYYVRKAF